MRFARLVAALRRLGNRTLLTTWRAMVEFVDDRGHRDAAQIAFFAILSAIPLGLLLVGSFGLLFDDAEVRRRVVTTVFDHVPLSTDQDRVRVERAPQRFQMIEVRGQNYYRTLRDKLGWAGNLYKS